MKESTPSSEGKMLPNAVILFKKIQVQKRKYLTPDFVLSCEGASDVGAAAKKG